MMTRLLVVLLVGLVLEAVGVVLISRGQKELKAEARFEVRAMVGLVKEAATNRNILTGIALEAGFFGCLLFLLSRGDVSFIWPLTAMGFVVTTLSAKFLLREEVSGLRWFGVFLIVLGAGVITYTEKSRAPRDKPPAERPADR
jgi:drug/metabolite transporter (DMT)-like permease